MIILTVFADDIRYYLLYFTHTYISSFANQNVK